MSFHSVVIQKLLSTNSHIGRRVTSHHFKIFSEGTRNSVSIIDSDKTLICLRNACNFIGLLARNNARFLFVNTNTLFDEIIGQMTQQAGIKNDNTWRLGGFLTNSSSPKKFRGRNKKLNLSAVQPPDCIVIFDTERKSSVIQEAYKLQIPVVGLVDSSMPLDTYKKITYPVPANDSVEFVYLFCNLITKTILKEQKEATAEKDKTRGEVEQDDQVDGAGMKFVFSYENLQDLPEGLSETKQLLDKLVVLKFNDGLGTNIGFDGPKCAIQIGGGLTSLDLIISQIESLNAKYGCKIPLLFVNAANAHEGVLKVLEKHSNKNIHSIIESQHHLENAHNFELPSAEGREEDEMDTVSLAEVLLPLVSSGQLDMLISQGKEYIVMLASDNVAHIVDPKILKHLIQNNIKCCLEVLPKPSETEESKYSQTEEQIPKILTPKKKWRFIDTMWMNINSIESILAKCTAKVQPTISKLFDQHFALSVPKSRYLPVETTLDLFLLKSDLYIHVDGTLIRNTARENPVVPSIELGSEFVNVNDFHRRFKSIPSILGLDSLKVTGDVWFGDGITIKGQVSIHAKPGIKITVPDGTVLENKIITNQEELEQGFSYNFVEKTI